MEDQIEDYINQLLKTPKLVSIDISSPGDCGYREGKSKTGSILDSYKNRVYVTLVEGDDFNSWLIALEKAIILINTLVDKLKWEENNPIFTERLKSKIRNSQLHAEI